MYKLTDTLSGVREEPGPEVPNLSVEEFDEKVIDPQTLKTRDGKSWFIKFYAPWCGHCRKFAPDWKKFYNTHKEELNIARVDCTGESTRAICERFQIHGFPSLIFFKDDMSYRFGRKEKRRIEQLEAFALQEGYLKVDDDEKGPIPKKLEHASLDASSEEELHKLEDSIM